MTARCPAGHELPGGRRQADACPQCRRDTLIRHVISADGTLPAGVAAAAVDAAAATPAALRDLAAALAADPDMLRHGAPPLAGAGCRAHRPRLGLPDDARLRPLRPGREAAVPDGGRGHVQAVRRPRAHGRLRSLRRGQGRRRPGLLRPVHLRAVPAACPGAPLVRALRAGSPDRGAGTRRRARHLRQLLPAARRRLQRLRQIPALQLRCQRPSGLPVVLAEGDLRLRPLQAGPAAGGAVARRPGLRPVLRRRAARPGPVRGLRPGPAPGLPARPGRRHLRGLRRAPRHVRLHQLRHRGQALRKRTVRPVQPAAPRHGTPVGRDRERPRGDERRARGDLLGPQPAHRAELAAPRGQRRDPRRRRGRPHRRRPRGTRPAPAAPRRRVPPAGAHRRRRPPSPRRGTRPRRAVARRPAGIPAVPGAPAARPRIRHLAGHAPASAQRPGQAPPPDAHRRRAELHQRSRPPPGLARRTRDHAAAMPPG